jgi:hypothetical protein
MRNYQSVLLIAPCLLLGAGCSPIDVIKERIATALTEKVVEGAVESRIRQEVGKDVNVDFDKQGISFTDPTTGQTFAIGESVTIPEDFPTDVPRYPNATPKSVSVVEARNDAALLLETTDTRTAITTWYTEEAVKMGWKTDKVFETTDNAVLTFLRGENGGSAKLTVTIPPPDDQKRITIIIGRSGVKEE